MKVVISLICAIFIITSSMFAQVTGLSGWNIFLDPGHSQKENMGIYGYSEAEKNLRVGLALQQFLLTETDIDTVYICRTNDQQQVSLSQRTDYANRLGAAWYHSIHSDAGSPEYTSTLLLWGQDYYKNEKVPNGGKAMADIIVDILTAGMRTSTRGSIGDCTFYQYTGACTPSWPGPYLHVNRTTTMPSELSEAGFHTNPVQNQLNMNAEFRKLQARTFFWSFLEYFAIPRPFVGICTGIITDEENNEPINGAKITINGQTYVTDTYQSLFYQYTNDSTLLHNGFYYLEKLPSGTLELVVEAPGYYTDTSQVIISADFFTFKDVKLISKTPPFIISTTPTNGEVNFPSWDNIVIDFSRPMNQTSVETTFSTTPPTSGTFTWQDNNKQMIFKSDTLQFETDYTITISGNSTDIYGHPFDGNGDGIGGDNFSFGFKTGLPDMSPPKLLSIYPPQTSSNIELQPVVNVTYDEEIDSVSITGDLFKLERFQDKTGVNGVLKTYLVNKQTVLCFFPAEKLFPNEIYITRIFPGFYDLFGNEVTSTKSYSFKTADEDLSITSIDNFESNVTGNWWAPQQSGSTTGILTEATSRNSNNQIVNLLTGSQTALQLNYGWDTSFTSWLIREYLGDGSAPKSVLFDKSYIMQVYVFGDGSGNQFRFCVDDKYPATAAENHEVSPWFTVDWLGWKLVSWDMTNDGTGTWIGDGNLDGTLRLESLQLTYNPGSPTTGTFYFDDLRVVKKVAVSVDVTEPELPDQFVLYQNYPNPFNAETTIKYQIPGEKQYVRLAIFDILGQKIRTLVNENQINGSYQIDWNGKDDRGKDVASGAYIYKIDIGKLSDTKRMILLR